MKQTIDSWNGEPLPPGESRDVSLAVSESYSGSTIRIPLHISRAPQPGPTVFVTAALHGDEINGTGAVRNLIQDQEFQIVRGSIIMVPVLNLPAFDRHSRYLPDRRDLNRCFPGSPTGSLASRMANTIFEEIVARCDFGIDLHTAAVHRTNYPNVRGDLGDPQIRNMAEAFGCEVMLNSRGPRGSFRREACSAGCPTIVVEAGEVCKVEPGIVESTVTGIKNVLAHLGMLPWDATRPAFQVAIEKTRWVRAEKGGFLQFHVQPGEIIERGQALATNTTLLGRERSILESPFNAVVLGMTTLPCTSPGEPVCNLGKLPKRLDTRQLRKLRSNEAGLAERITEELASNVLVVEPSEESRAMQKNTPGEEPERQ